MHLRKSVISRRAALRRGESAIWAAIEGLESRVMFSAFNVLNTNDAGSGSFRQAILNADSAGGTNAINFVSGVGIHQTIVMGTIILQTQLPQITCNITINGSGRTILAIDGENEGSVLRISGGLTANISGMKIEGGQTTESSPNGGGIFDPGGANSSVTINSCTITGNSALGKGGGIYCGDAGGGVSCSLSVSNSSIFENSGIGNQSDGGGIACMGASLTITSSTVTGDTAVVYGGGIYCSGSVMHMSTTTVNGNSAEIGGGIYGRDDLFITACTISGNSAGGNGGGIDGRNSKFDDITICTFNGNTAGSSGGAMYLGESAEVTDCTISGNSAPNVGGVYFRYVYGYLSFDGTIDAGNSGGDFQDNSNHPASGSFDLIGDGSDGGVLGGSLRGTVSSPLNPMLAALAFNGGLTQTMALEAGSPAIGKGFGFYGTDQRGAGLPDSNWDIGAYQTGPIFVNTLNDSVIAVLGKCSLRDAIEIDEDLGTAQTIEFEQFLSGEINLVTQLPPLTSNLNIDAGAANTQMAVNGGGFGSVFTVNPGVSVQIENLAITGGAPPISSGGGGIINSGTLSVINCSISGNASPNGGGGIYSIGSLKVTNCTFNTDTASTVGGAVEAAAGTVTVTDCTISGNTAQSGAGLYEGAGVTSCVIDGTIIAANSGGDIARQAGGAALIGSHDVIGDGSDGGVLTGSFRGTVNTPLNPDLEPLANNGGFGPTMALFSGSPAVGRNIDFPVFDAGGNDVTIFDERGFPRSAGQGNDIGAYQSGPLAVNILTDPATETFGDLSLREAINIANTFGLTQTITFAIGLTGTVEVTGNLPVIAENMAIDGPGTSIITVNGSRNNFLFTINSNSLENNLFVEFNDFTITSGGIANFANLTIGGTMVVGKLVGSGRLTIGTASQSARLDQSGNSGTSTQDLVVVNNGSALDIANNRFLINYGAPFGGADPIASLTGDLATGYAGGAWDGSSPGSGAIISGYAEGTGSVTRGVGINDGNKDSGGAAAQNQIVLKYTLMGDANLDGQANFSDLVTVVQNFNKSGTDWAQGNFEYGSSTSFGDLVAVIQNFNKALIPAGSSGETDGGTAQPIAAGQSDAAARPGESVVKNGVVAVNQIADSEAAAPAGASGSLEEDILQSGADGAFN